MLRSLRTVLLSTLTTLSFGCAVGDVSDGAAQDVATDMPGIDSITIDAADAVVESGNPTGDTGMCASGATLCGSSCVDLHVNPMNCAACGHACTAGPNARPQCVASMCSVTCADGFGECDHLASTGCETSLNSAANCGMCGMACPSGQVCSAGACVAGCPAGQQLCSTTMSCADTMTDPSNCGACGTTCMTANGLPVCTGGHCGIASCSTGFDDCDHVLANGCETRIGADPANCGGCGTVCPGVSGGSATCETGVCRFTCNVGNHLCGGACVSNASVSACGASCSACSTPPNATPTCNGTACGFTCQSGFADCDHDPANGCEATLASSPNCGACGTSCAGATPLCAPMGAGYGCMGGGCPAGMPTMCGATCADLSNDPAHCGSCANACATPNATPACSGGACAVASCNVGFGDCNGSAADGCETNLQSDMSHCGACGRTCPVGSTCSGGACQCSPGLDLCGTQCVDLTANRSNCGSCGRVCAGTTICCCGVCIRPLLCARPEDEEPVCRSV